jgi:DNA-binding NtrC family response regulator
MPTGRLLLVAADTELRRSLVFALETEGFSVTVRDVPPPRSWLVSNRFDCTILDQHALPGPDYESIAFCIKAHPVVLVANAVHPWLVEWVAEVVEMPLRADAVSSAVHRAMHDEAA